MTDLTLYYGPTSPYVRKVMVVLHETGQLEDVTVVTTTGTPLDSARMPLSQNPLGKVPVLARADGPAIIDSRVICRYLDARAKAGLYPKGEELWSVLTLEALAEGILDAALQMSYETRLRPEGQRSTEIVDGLWAKIERAVAMLETRWMGHLSGRFGIGQIAVGAALGYLDLRHDARGWRTGAPALATWFQGVSGRPSFVATAPPADA